MICKEYLAEFIHTLELADDTVAISPQAFELLRDRYHLGKILMRFFVPSSIYTKEGDKKEIILFIVPREQIPFQRKKRRTWIRY